MWAQGFTIDAMDWNCTTCTYLNQGRVHRCKVCSAPRGSSRRHTMSSAKLQEQQMAIDNLNRNSSNKRAKVTRLFANTPNDAKTRPSTAPDSLHADKTSGRLNQSRLARSDSASSSRLSEADASPMATDMNEAEVTPITVHHIQSDISAFAQPPEGCKDSFGLNPHISARA